MMPWAHPSPQLKWHLDWFNRFPRMTAVSLYFTMGCPFPPPSKLPILMGVCGPHLIHGSLVPLKSSTQTPSRSAIFQGWLVWHTVWQTDHDTWSVTNINTYGQKCDAVEDQYTQCLFSFNITDVWHVWQLHFIKAEVTVESAAVVIHKCVIWFRRLV